jgi:hypothetical protein
MVKLRALPDTPKPPQERDGYPALSNLVDCYFFQDYDIWGETPDEIVEVYKYAIRPIRPTQLIDDLQRFLTQYGKSEEELEAAFDRVFHPEMAIYGWNGRTLREALLRIIEILSDENNPGRPAPL